MVEKLHSAGMIHSRATTGNVTLSRKSSTNRETRLFKWIAQREKTVQSTEVVPRKFSVLGHMQLRDGFSVSGIWRCLRTRQFASKYLKELLRQQTEELEKVRVASIGKKGSLTAIMRNGIGSRRSATSNGPACKYCS